MKNVMTTKAAGIGKRVLTVILLSGLLALTGCQSKEALKNEKAYRQVGINKMEEGDFEGAVKAFQKALDQSLAVVGDLELDISYYKAAAQYNSGDSKGAAETYTALIDLDKKNADAYYLRGTIYLKEGDEKKAMKDYNKAFELKTEDYELYVSVYENLINAGSTQQAEKILESALKLGGEKAEDFRERGHIYLLKGDYENARKELDKAINKEDSKALFYMAQVYDAQGNHDQAKALYESYIAKNGADITALNDMGEMQLAAGNYQQALEFFQQALASKDKSNEQQLRRNEIIAYESLKDFASARAKMEAYLAEFPEDTQAQREYVFLQTR